MHTVIKVLSAIATLVGGGSTILGALFFFMGDNSDARALAEFISIPFLLAGIPLLALWLLGLLL